MGWGACKCLLLLNSSLVLDMLGSNKPLCTSLIIGLDHFLSDPVYFQHVCIYLQTHSAQHTGLRDILYVKQLWKWGSRIMAASLLPTALKILHCGL